MVQIFFFSPSGYAPLKDPALKMLLIGSHGWQSDGDSWVYGVCTPAPHINPNDVADLLESLGVIIIPGKHDPTKRAHATVVQALAKHGIDANDTGADIAIKMHAKSGMPHLKPHFF